MIQLVKVKKCRKTQLHFFMATKVTNNEFFLYVQKIPPPDLDQIFYPIDATTRVFLNLSFVLC